MTVGLYTIFLIFMYIPMFRKIAAKVKGKEMENQQRSLEIFSSISTSPSSALSNQWGSYNTDDYSATGIPHWAPQPRLSRDNSASSSADYSSFYGTYYCNLTPPVPYLPNPSMHHAMQPMVKVRGGWTRLRGYIIIT